MRAAITIACMLIAAPICAETCKYVDKDGHVTYSNAPVPNARKLSCIETPPPISTDKSSQSEPAPHPGQDAAKPTAVPSSKDANGRKALEKELAREQEALQKAQAELAQQQSIRLGDERSYARVLERLKPFQDAVASHESRIDAIKQELSSTK